MPEMWPDPPGQTDNTVFEPPSRPVKVEHYPHFTDQNSSVRPSSRSCDED